LDSGADTEGIKPFWELLPPHDELVEGCKVFLDCSFQLGFLPKLLFLERLRKDPESMNVFLLLCMLGVSARFTPSLIRRYGGHAKATRVFIERAERLVPTEIYKTTLEVVQAFILLGTAGWANGDVDRSLVSIVKIWNQNLILRNWYLDSPGRCCDDGWNASPPQRRNLLASRGCKA
jgi:hypothetical protein